MAQAKALGEGNNFPTAVGGYLPYNIFAGGVSWVGSTFGEAATWYHKSPLNPFHDYRSAKRGVISAASSVSSGVSAVANKTMSILEIILLIVGGLVILYIFSIYGGLRGALK